MARVGRDRVENVVMVVPRVAEGSGVVARVAQRRRRPQRVIRRIENGIEVSSRVSQGTRVLRDRDMVHRHDGAVVIGELVLWSPADGGRRQGAGCRACNGTTTVPDSRARTTDDGCRTGWR